MKWLGGTENFQQFLQSQSSQASVLELCGGSLHSGQLRTTEISIKCLYAWRWILWHAAISWNNKVPTFLEATRIALHYPFEDMILPHVMQYLPLDASEMWSCQYQLTEWKSSPLKWLPCLVWSGTSNTAHSLTISISHSSEPASTTCEFTATQP